NVVVHFLRNAHDHILARVDRVLDLDWLREEVADLYCADNGQSAVSGAPRHLTRSRPMRVWRSAVSRRAPAAITAGYH
ncbi:MAG: hypothetical protein EOS79_33550, partial [Mesorhizobium sp.]